MIEFSYELRDLGIHGLELVLIGYMDEQTVLPKVEKVAQSSRLIINFGRVNAVLSMGVKTWVRFADQLEKYPNLRIEFKNCSRQVVDQINLVKGFLTDNATVTSMFIPIFCETCNRTFKVLKKTENITSEIHKVIAGVEVPDCDKFPGCKESFELECNPTSYLKFIERRSES